MRKLIIATAMLLVLAGAGTSSAQLNQQPKLFGVFETTRLDLVVKNGLKVAERDLWVTPGYRHLSDLPAADQQSFNDYMSYAESNDLKVVLNIWQIGWPINGQQYPPPTRPNQWRGTCDVAVDAVKQYPSIIGLAVGAEPNSQHFWSAQNSAPMAYTAWLAICYDRIKAVRPDVSVYGGSLASRAGPGGTSPQDFIAAMCQAYQKSGRTTPIMDGFDMHWYASDSPDTKHTTSISIGDYDQLEGLLSCFGNVNMPILWGEGGYESQIPSWQAYRYGGSLATWRKPIDEATQAAWYAQAIQMAACQPNTVGIFIFHMVDDPELGQWQSGLYYANPNRSMQGTGGYTDAPKASLAPVVQEMQAAASSTLQCR